MSPETIKLIVAPDLVISQYTVCPAAVITSADVVIPLPPPNTLALVTVTAQVVYPAE